MNDTETKTGFIRGQICYVKGDPDNMPVGSETWADRYALIVSNDVNNNHSGTVEVVYLTTSPRKKAKLPTHVFVKSGKKKKTAIAMCEAVFTVDKSRISSFTNRITEQEQNKVDAALALSFGISPSSDAHGLFRKWENYINRWNLSASFTETNAQSPDSLMLKAMTKERDGYKALYESAQAQLSQIKNCNKRMKTKKGVRHNGCL